MLMSHTKQEGTDLLREALSRTYKERFLFAIQLYKIQQTINKAKITHKPYIIAKINGHF